ncbi:bacillithiol biosynthesis cysteine-adding enzyme BshC [Bhargavaea cecembensis]|nr:bacillithiol biosynthesis cysteine-adding enzyme BshC [Bhargavaea cecembensis]
MEFERLDIRPAGRVMDAYFNDPDFIHTYFDYSPDAEGYAARLKELESRTFDRAGLSRVIRGFMGKAGLSEEAEAHLLELEEGAPAVVGGQQAGLLTGPLYSVNKALSVVAEARRLRAELGTPVVPIFWIAGEDHDLLEINHVYAISDDRPVKRQFPVPFGAKTMASETAFDPAEMEAYIRSVFRDYGETAHTESLIGTVLDCLEGNPTFTSFFAALMARLFSEEGLLLLDAADPALRQLEAPHFENMVRNSAAIAAGVAETEERFVRDGFDRPLGSDGQDAHLFYVESGERFLLRREDGKFVNSQAGFSFSEDELAEIAHTRPELLSNNVVTRPVMQDLAIPVLTFVGGPGEIAYWSLLRPAFREMGIRMPVIIPRQSLTFISRLTASLLSETGLSEEEVLAGMAEEEKQAFIDRVSDREAAGRIARMEEQLNDGYRELSASLESRGRNVRELIEKNIAFHERQFNYLKEKIRESVLLEHETAIRRYSRLEAELLPEGGFQERKFSPFQFMNEYGPGFISDLAARMDGRPGDHHLVRL